MNDERIEAPGGWTPRFWLDWYMSLGGMRPSFRPLRGWRTWWRRGTAGGPLLGHVTPPVLMFSVRDVLPVVTAPRGQIVYIERAFAESLKRRRP